MMKKTVKRTFSIWFALAMIVAALALACPSRVVQADSVSGPVITTQPTDKTVEIGSVAKFTVEATGEGTLSYRWQSRKTGWSGWATSSQSGVNTKTLSVDAGETLNDWQFRCVVTDGNGQKTYSDAVTLTVKPRIDTQPEDTYAPAGTTATFKVTATGAGTLKYQWQSRKDSTATWTNSGQTGAKTDTLSVKTSAGLQGWQFRCVVTDGNNQKSYSNAATVYVKLTFTEQPKTTSTTADATAQFSVQVIGKEPFTYQWQSRKNASSTWTNSGQNGSRTATLSVKTTAGLNGWQFRCVVKDAAGQTAVSSAATLYIIPKITKQPADASVTVGGTAKFTMAATGKATLTYQWQSRKDSSSEWANSGQTGAKTATLSVKTTAGLHGWQFRCVVTDGNGRKSATRAATLKVLPKITTQPGMVSATAGEVAKFTVAAIGKAPLSYQWQSRKDSSSSWSNSGQTGSKTETLSVATRLALNGWHFRCVVTDANGQKVYSEEATLLLTIGTIPINAENFPDDIFREFVQTNYDTDEDGYLTVEERNAVYRIDVHSSHIQSLKGIEFFSNLLTLTCYSNPISALNLSRNWNLSSMDCSATQLTALDVSNCPDLRYLECGFNSNLKKLDLSKNTNLETLYCSNCSFEALNLEKQTNLESLFCYNNYLTELDLSTNTNLMYLHCQGNKLTELKVDANTLLKDLNCKDNKITELDLTKNTALTRVTVDPGVNVIGVDSSIIKN